MQFAVTYPLVSHPHDPALVTGEAVRRFSQTAEAVGFHAVSFTDHPAPTHRWLTAGGHDSLDPFVALTWAAAATERLRLIPNIVVLPYRNPFLVAKAAATLDALSGGRFVLAVAAGYLRGEYQALGVDFEQRNERFDEAVEVIRRVWTEDDLAHEGTHFSAPGQSVNPKPDPLPPLWIGGNSRLSRRRVARYGDGWRPFPAPRGLASTAKTPPLEGPADLAPMLDELWVEVEAAGRDPGAIDVSFGAGTRGRPGTEGFDPDATLEALAELATLGVTWADVSVPSSSLDQSLEALVQFGESVISQR